MDREIPHKIIPSLFSLSFLIIFMVFIGSCSDSGLSRKGESNSLPLDLELQDSITGGKTVPSSRFPKAESVLRKSKGIGSPCFFRGVGDSNIFENGLKMTQFMATSASRWTCTADTIIDITDFFPHDGLIKESENNTLSGSYDTEKPTHFSIADDFFTKKTIKLYYGFDRLTPPTQANDPQLFISWTVDNAGNINGRLTIDIATIDQENRSPEDPVSMRMDFNFNETQKIADIYFRFDAGNEFAKGFRFEVIKDLNTNPFLQVFLLRGLMDMKPQFLPIAGISELPVFQVYAVTNALGKGAAIAEILDASLGLELNSNTGNHLGLYIFNKVDKYFFDADQTSDEPWDWINKTFSNSNFRGGRTTPETGGTFNPFDPSLDLIVSFLGLDSDYFTLSKCNNMNDDCTGLLNAIFSDGFAGQEPNQGVDPGDWRSSAVANPMYLNSVFPPGFSDWDGVFDPIFNP